MAVKYLSHLETLNINMQGYELQNAVIHTLTNNTKPVNPNVGQVIYNTDNQTLELWDGVNWSSVSGDITSITITTGVGLQGGVVGVTGAVTGSISLNHLGLEDLVDPNKDSIFYWNDLTKKSEFLDIGDGLLINSGVLSNTIINNDQLINGSGYITADSSDTLTNKSGNISQWTNDIGYITDGNTNWNNTYGFITGINWDEITGNQLDINLSGFNNDSGFTTFDGDYNSLSNLPTIPTNNNQLINGAGYITTGNDGWVNTYGFITGVNWDEIGGLQSDINLSGFTNDVGFVSGDEFDSSGTYLNLRAQATTKGDVGLGNVENISLSTYTGNGGSLDNQYIINSEGYITGINWDGIGGTQSDINLSGFTNDIGFSTFDGDYNSLTNIPTYTQGSIIFADSDGSLTENNSQLYWDNVNNRLGIGTKNPTEKLDVAKKTNLTATTSTISAFTHTSTETTTAGFGINVDFKLQQPNSGNLVTANRVTSKWNNQSVSGEYTISSMYSATVGSQGSLHNVATFGVSPVTGLPGIITLHDTPSQSSRIKSENGRLIVDVGSQGSLYLGNFNAVKRVSNSTLITGFSGVVFSGNNSISTHMLINSSGNVGIGTTNPIETLDVIGNIKADGILKLYDITDTQKISLNPDGDSYINSGNVGIGTSNPAVDLHVADDVRIDSDLFVRTISSQYFSSSNNLNLIYGDAANFNIYSNTTERFRITSDGNVGIGTTTPNDKLDIDGDIRVKRTNRKPTHEDVLTSDFVSVGSVSFYTDDWVKVKVIGRGDTGVNKSFAEYLIYYDGANYNIELLNNIVIGDNSGFPLLRMNGSNLEIKNRDSVNVGNYLIYFDDFISQTLFSGKTYRVEDFPLIWINDLYYNTYKDNTFVPNQNISIPNQSEYDAVTNIDLDNQNLTTDFTLTFLSKFVNLQNLSLESNFSIQDNFISIIDVSENYNLQTIRANFLPDLEVLNVTNLTKLNTIFARNNKISVLNITDLTLLTYINVASTLIEELDTTNLNVLNFLRSDSCRINAENNSKILVDLDTHGLSNGYLNSTIFGTGFITPTGIDSFNALLSKSWNIVGLTNQISAGTTYNVEDFPKIWIDDLYYNTYKGDTFVPSINTLMTGQIEYDAVTIIDLNTQSLTTDFTNTLLKKFSNLQELKVNNNSIQVLDPSELYELIVLDCHNNSIEVLDVSQLTELTTLYCYINQIEVLDTTNLTKLTNLVCYTNQIQVLDTSQLVDLLVIDCQYNQIQVLDISNSLDLNFLRCNNNQIQVLPISQLTKLAYIDCNSNQIQSLDTSLLNLLTTFYCHNNLLTNLDISQNVNLVNLTCYGNQLDNLVNSQILIDLDTNGLSNGFLNSSIFGGGSLTAAGQIAKINLLSKGWTIVGI